MYPDEITILYDCHTVSTFEPVDQPIFTNVNAMWGNPNPVPINYLQWIITTRILRKTDEFLIPLLEISSQVLCLSEHHLGIDKINKINFSPYTLRAQYCRRYYKKGGVAIFVNNNIQSNIIDLEQFSKEKDLEVCALRISLPQKSLIIICIYRSPTGNFKYFINQLEAILYKIYKVETYIIVCRDFNINHLETPTAHSSGII